MAMPPTTSRKSVDQPRPSVNRVPRKDLDKPGLMWTELDRTGLRWTQSDKSGQIWTNLNTLHARQPVKHRKSCRASPKFPLATQRSA